MPVVLILTARATAGAAVVAVVRAALIQIAARVDAAAASVARVALTPIAKATAGAAEASAAPVGQTQTAALVDAAVASVGRVALTQTARVGVAVAVSAATVGESAAWVLFIGEAHVLGLERLLLCFDLSNLLLNIATQEIAGARFTAALVLRFAVVT